MRIKSYKDAVRLALAAGQDAANRRARNAGRKAWSAADHDRAAQVTERILADLGFDIAGWLVTAGLPRNEPPDPPVRKRAKRRSGQTPVQLSFAFV